MSAKFTVQNGDLEIEMTWVGLTDKIQRVVEDAAAYLFNKGYGDHGTEEEPRDFDDQSNQERLNMVYNHFTTVAKNAADTWASTEAQRVAREATVPHEL